MSQSQYSSASSLDGDDRDNNSDSESLSSTSSASDQVEVENASTSGGSTSGASESSESGDEADSTGTTTPPTSPKIEILQSDDNIPSSPEVQVTPIASNTPKLENVEAAGAARSLLLEHIPTLPTVVNNYVINSLGKIQMESSTSQSSQQRKNNSSSSSLLSSIKHTPYSSASSIHPVGFSCIRMEFSPIHGRVMKLKCEIQTGPKFIITWGRTVDNEVEMPETKFDPFRADDIDETVAKPGTAGGAHGELINLETSTPVLGMRVNVKFEEDGVQWYGGTLIKVVKCKDSKRRKKDLSERWNIRIRYDDGATEDATYPDPEIELCVVKPPVAKEEDIVVEESTKEPIMCGENTTRIVGDSPLEAWGKCLISLGLIDECLFEEAVIRLDESRKDGINYVRERAELQRKQRREARVRQKMRERGGSEEDAGPRPIVVRVVEGEAVQDQCSDDDLDDDDEEDGDDEEREEESEREKQLKERLAGLKEEYERMKEIDISEGISLANARIKAIGPFLCNPFNASVSHQQQLTWLSAIVRKEKVKMGSTGNKRKIVTATDLLEKMDTFFSPDIERLVEGLPGSEYCPSYVFHSNRAAGASAANQTWVHEATIRNEKEREKEVKAKKEAKEKASQLREKEMKRREREEERESRRMKKMEEQDKKKKAREEERLNRLSLQVDDRLFKEACFQREKVVLLAAKALGKEYNRRRKAAEVASAYHAESETDGSHLSKSYSKQQPVTPPLLPPLFQPYDESVLRIWDFVTSFQSAFTKYSSSTTSSPEDVKTIIPTVDELQSALSSPEGTLTLTNLSVTLCQPLASSVNKILSTVVTQKDTSGLTTPTATTPSSTTTTTTANGTSTTTPANPPSSSTITTLPVNTQTWREIARLSLLNDALVELNFSKQDCAHILRGYRSGGHPNSKEAKRLRQGEDYVLNVLKQRLVWEVKKSTAKNGDGKGTKAAVVAAKGVKVRVNCPGDVSAKCSDWVFYLHNVKALECVGGASSSADATPASATTAAAVASQMKGMVRKAMSLLKSNTTLKGKEKDGYMTELQKGLSLMEAAYNPEQNLIKGRAVVLKLLDKVTGECYSKNTAGGEIVTRVVTPDKPKNDATKDISAKKPMVSKRGRERMGMINQQIGVTKDLYKKFCLERESYMVRAVEDMRMRQRREQREKKKEQKRESSDGKNIEGDNEEDDDDDDDEDEDEDEDDGNSQCNSQSSQTNNNNNEDDKDDSNANSNSNGDTNKDKNENDNTTSETNNKTSTTTPSKLPSKPPTLEVPIATAITTTDTTTDVTALATEVPSSPSSQKIGKTTPYDDFCADIPTAPTSIRRCLAVLRTICISPLGGAFVYPVDPQANPRYYETVLQPMCLQDVGRELIRAATLTDQKEIEMVVAQFARNIRRISQNCSVYSPLGAAIISYAEQLLRIFERLFLDWVLAPPGEIAPLDSLYDDRCVDHHVSDEESLVLICDGCEGKFNMGRLDPPVLEVPQGDWYCPRCLGGRWWGDLDPRMGKEIKKKIEGTEFVGVVRRCLFCHDEGDEERPMILYVVEYEDGDEETWTLEEVDACIEPRPPKIENLEAIAESPGYGIKPDNGLTELLPSQLNPYLSDAAAQASLSSSVFRECIASVATLSLVNTPQDLNPQEWMRVLMLLCMKSSTSEDVQDVQSRLENEAADRMGKEVAKLGGVKDVKEILDGVESDDERDWEDSDEEEDKKEEMVGTETSPTVEQGKGDGEVNTPGPKKRKKDNNTDESTETTSDRKRLKGGSGGAANAGSSEEEEWMDDPNDVSNTANKPTPAIPSKNNDTTTNSNSKSKDDTKKQQELPPTTSLSEPSPPLPITSSTTTTPQPTNTPQPDLPTSSYSTPDISQQRQSALSLKSDRLKSREDSLIAHGIKNQLRSTIASFETDGLTDVIDAALSSTPDGWNACVSPTGVACAFCGLSDVALGVPLVRCPNRKEWMELMPRHLRLRSTRLVAEVSSSSRKDEEDETQPPKKKKPRLLSVSIRANGALVSSPPSTTLYLNLPSNGMFEFLPYNPIGFQRELLHRSSSPSPPSNLPHISGSLAAHDCCAQSVHNARIDALLRQHRKACTLALERDYGRGCGRTLPIGFDRARRSYWCFNADRGSLFVNDADGGDAKCMRFSKAEEIAAVIVSLGEDERESELRGELKRLFPKAERMIKRGKWKELLQRRKWRINRETLEAMDDIDDDEGGESSAMVVVKEDESKLGDVKDDKVEETKKEDEKEQEEDEAEDEDVPFEEGEEVLVESKSGKMLWDATIIAVSKDPTTQKINGYRVHYTNWPSRFDDWVKPLRVVEPNENNILVQEDMLDEINVSREGIPASLNHMLARKYLHAKNRARSNITLLPSFAPSGRCGPGASDDDKTMALLRTALLLIEAALPKGSVDTKNVWKPELALCWRKMVTNAKGAVTLMECLVLLEDAISEKWMRPQSYYLLSCMPRHWKAINDATVSSVALRIWILDEGIKFHVTDKLSGDGGGGGRRRSKG